MKKYSKEDLIIREILEHDYNGDSLVIGRVDQTLMSSMEQRIISGIGQNIALINMMNKDMEYADKSRNQDIIFEYIWGFIYQYIYNNPILRQKYIDSEVEEKLAFFSTLLGRSQDINFLNENKNNLFSWEARRIITTRGESDFKVCLLNYQNITSLYLVKRINMFMRERPPMIIFTEECGLKSGTTGVYGGSVDPENDFAYFNAETGNRDVFEFTKSMLL